MTKLEELQADINAAGAALDAAEAAHVDAEEKLDAAFEALRVELKKQKGSSDDHLH